MQVRRLLARRRFILIGPFNLIVAICPAHCALALIAEFIRLQLPSDWVDLIIVAPLAAGKGEADHALEDCAHADLHDLAIEGEELPIPVMGHELPEIVSVKD